MPTIKWTKQHKKFVIIPDKCHIIIPAEYNKFYLEGPNGFKVYHCDFGWSYNYAVFMWKHLITDIELDDRIDFLTNQRLPLTGELLKITFIWLGKNKGKITIEKYTEELNENIWSLDHQIPEIEWKGETMKIPDECKVKIPSEYNCICDTTPFYIRLLHFEDEKGETGITLYWDVPIMNVLVEVKNRSFDFDVTEVDPRMPNFLLNKGRFKINKKEIKTYELTTTFELSEKQKLYKKLTFTPIEKIKDWWAEPNYLLPNKLWKS